MNIIELNLTSVEKSVIKYKISKFPDGQQGFDLIDKSEVLSLESLSSSNNVEIEITSRLNNFKDLELILCATAAIKELGFTNQIVLNVPYFLGARSDRKFYEGGYNYIKSVISPIINAQGYKRVEVMDPHSDVLEACIQNFKKISNMSLIEEALPLIDNTDLARKNIAVVSPDAGALKKVFDVVQQFNIPNLLIGSKHRDIKTGDITHTEIAGIESSEAKKFVIIDDICDGGRTFIELAKVIKKTHPTSKCYLIVTHGIFSKGLYQLSDFFEKIFTTNSVHDIDAVEYSDHTVSADFLYQKDVLL